MSFRLILYRLQEYSRHGVFLGLSGIFISGPIFGYMLWESYEKELALIDHATVVRAELVDVGTYRGDPRTGDPGGAEGTYRYTRLDGKDGTVSISADSLDDILGSTDDGVEVEYLPENPKVKRVTGSGNTNISDLKFWTVFKGVLLSLFLLMSIALTVSDLRKV